MTDSGITFTVEMFPRFPWRWNFAVCYSDGIVLRSTRSSWGYGRTLAAAMTIGNGARS